MIRYDMCCEFDGELSKWKDELGEWVLYSEARAEINALKAELAASISVREEMQLGGNRMAEYLRFAKEEIAYLKSENQSIKIHVAELRKENARYEFLRERASDEEWPEWCTWEMLGEAEGDEWDALIDRLMDEY